ncbi:MAG: thiolase domain-containing protein [Candidatus Heimdallarchaeota archaeon]|nr:thiolase domain-containing protein [Candidatus Heimdallarchaeota archaeon]
MTRKVGMVSVGLTKFQRRAKETAKELAYYSAKMALDEAGITRKDVDGVIVGSAPDAFDGVHQKHEYLTDGSGGFNLPTMRGYVGGGTGVFSPIQGWYHIASGMHDVMLITTEEKMSSVQPSAQAAFLTIFDNMIERPLGPNLVWIFALEMKRYMEKHGIPKEHIASVSVKNKGNAVDHPSAMLGKKWTLDEVLNSELLADPVRLLDISPVADGAVSFVMMSEEKIKEYGISKDDVAWVDGVGWNVDTTMWTNRDLYYPKYVEKAAKQAYNMAGMKDHSPEALRKWLTFAEPYDPFNYKELHHLEGLQLFGKGKAPLAAFEGVTARDGDFPVTPSGGLLGVGNPIAAAAGMKSAEVYLQLTGKAGKRQIDGRDMERGLAQAWGDLMQVGTVLVMKGGRVE